LPYVETVKLEGSFPATSRDREDDQFLACALAVKADVIVSGDDDLWTLKRVGKWQIISLGDFRPLLISERHCSKPIDFRFSDVRPETLGKGKI
jgi:predicted nucleic acid-binding protein